MVRKVRNRQFNILDKFERLEVDQLVSIEQWLAQTTQSSTRQGVFIKASDDVYALASVLKNALLIALDFGNFDDGRSYSQVKLLRREVGYTGEIRALNVHLDHLPFIFRAGVNSYDLLSDDPSHEPEAIDIHVCYQAAENNVGLLEKHKLKREVLS